MKVKDLPVKLREGKKGEMAICIKSGNVMDFEIGKTDLALFDDPVIISKEYNSVTIAEKC